MFTCHRRALSSCETLPTSSSRAEENGSKNRSLKSRDLVSQGREKLTLELVSASDVIEIGGEITATVRITNNGEKPVNLPWAIDERVIRGLSQKRQDEGYEFASLSLELGARNSRDSLSTLKAEARLFAHGDLPESILALNPGQWADLMFKGPVSCKYKDLCGAFQTDDAAKLVASWNQWLFTVTYKDCEKTNRNYKARELEFRPRTVMASAAGSTH